MKKQIKHLAAFVHNYGLLQGTKLLLKTEIGNIKKLSVPGLKHPVSLRPHTSDLPVFMQVFGFNEYKINLANPKIIIDAGANIGMFSIYMKNLFPDCKIICIEPDKDNFRALEKNLADYSNIYLENCGLWNKDANLKINENYNMGEWGVMVMEDEKGPIPAVSIPSLMKKHSIDHIDLLKIDIETSEKQLFSDNYEEWLPKVKTIIIEFHDWLVPNCAKTFFEAVNRCFKDYELKSKGENIIIENKGM